MLLSGLLRVCAALSFWAAGSVTKQRGGLLSTRMNVWTGAVCLCVCVRWRRDKTEGGLFVGANSAVANAVANAAAAAAGCRCRVLADKQDVSSRDGCDVGVTGMKRWALAAALCCSADPHTPVHPLSRPPPFPTSLSFTGPPPSLCLQSARLLLFLSGPPHRARCGSGDFSRSRPSAAPAAGAVLRPAAYIWRRPRAVCCCTCTCTCTCHHYDRYCCCACACFLVGLPTPLFRKPAPLFRRPAPRTSPHRRSAPTAHRSASQTCSCFLFRRPSSAVLLLFRPVPTPGLLCSAPRGHCSAAQRKSGAINVKCRKCDKQKAKKEKQPDYVSRYRLRNGLRKFAVTCEVAIPRLPSRQKWSFCRIHVANKPGRKQKPGAPEEQQ